MVDRQSLKAALATTPECLDVTQLEKLTGEQAHAHPHVSKCVRCQSELAMLHSFESDEPVIGEGAAVAWISAQLERRRREINGSGAKPVTSTEVRNSWWQRALERWNMRTLAPVAIAAVVAIVGAITLQHRQEPDLRAGIETQSPIYRSQQVELLAPSGELPRPPAILEWKAFPGAATYKVAIMEVDRNPLWTGETTRPKADVPRSIRDKMLPSKTVLWQVTALDAQGKILATSQAERMVVARVHSATPR